MLNCADTATNLKEFEFVKMAEKARFELARRFHVHTLSRRAP